MGNGHSLHCGKHHIYDKIDENQPVKSMGNRKESLVTLDVKIDDLDADERNKNEEKENSSDEWDRNTADEWFQENGWQTKQQYRKREDILYNIFMIETQDNHLHNYNFLRNKSSEPHYGRLASLDVAVLDVKNENNYF